MPAASHGPVQPDLRHPAWCDPFHCRATELVAEHRSAPVTVPAPEVGDPTFTVSLYSASHEPIDEATCHVELRLSMQPLFELVVAVPLGDQQVHELAGVLAEHATSRERYSPASGG